MRFCSTEKLQLLGLICNKSIYFINTNSCAVVVPGLSDDASPSRPSMCRCKPQNPSAALNATIF